ncbi:MAG: hypothetical protein ACFB13_21175 [Kiloniellaceae bacterium]
MNDILGKFLARLAEPSTYAGLAAIVSGAGLVGKINEAPQIVDAMSGAGQIVANGGGAWGGLLAVGLGVLSVFVPERGRRT